MTGSGWRCHLGYRPEIHGYEFWLSSDGPGKTQLRLSKFEFEQWDAGAGYLTPPETIPIIDMGMAGALQAIVDAAWEIGVKPKAAFSGGELGAANRHLEDMRALAFHKIGCEKP